MSRNKPSGSHSKKPSSRSEYEDEQEFIEEIILQTPEIDPSELEIINQIGSGCFGNVYSGKCRGKLVAIKKLHQQELEEDLLAEFKKEVEIMTHLRHPNIVLYMGSCTVPGHLAIVTELLPKGNLADLLRNPDIEITTIQKLKMAKDIAQGMNWLHCSKPPIIHRDLKPTNLLVDDNWNVKVCDFGLASVQKTQVMTDEGDAPGTPLWMSPEVLLGKPLSEKADIYSYGIVLWEVLTRTEPFDHMDSYNTFVKAICEEKERPPIPPNTPAPLQELLEACWHEDQFKRPSFAVIIELLDDILIECTIDDPVGQTMWKRNWKGRTLVEWEKFLKVFCTTLKIPTPTPTEVPYKCLHALLAKIKDDKDLVSLESFMMFLQWFGPMVSRVKLSIMEKVKLVQEGYFHGDISKTESESKLLGLKERTFLVRLSTTEPHKTPFTITRVTKKNQIQHTRVFVKPDRSGYFIHLKEGKKIEASGPLPNLIARAAKTFSLAIHCPGSKYASLFKNVAPAPYDEVYD